MEFRSMFCEKVAIFGADRAGFQLLIGNRDVRFNVQYLSLQLDRVAPPSKIFLKSGRAFVAVHFFGGEPIEVVEAFRQVLAAKSHELIRLSLTVASRIDIAPQLSWRFWKSH